MKKSLILALLGLAATAAATFGQGQINLDNYDSITHPLVRYYPGGPGVDSSFTAGLYWAPGNIVGSVAPDPEGMALPSTLNPAFVLATGVGSTGVIAGNDTFGTPGEYAPANSFNPHQGEGATITVMIIAYNSSSYTTATVRAHSTAFTMTTSVGVAFPEVSGNDETDGGFAVNVPEPSIFALAGLGSAALMIRRGRKPRS